MLDENAHDAYSSWLRGNTTGLGSDGLGLLLIKPPKPHRSPGCSKVPLHLCVHYWCVKAKGLNAEVEAITTN